MTGETMTRWKSHAVLFFFDVIGLIAAAYTVIQLVELWGAVAANKQGIVQDTSLGFGFIGLVVVGVHLLTVSKAKFTLGDNRRNILSIGLLVILILAAFMTNYLVTTHLKKNGYVVCGYTETSSRRKHPYWMPVRACESKIREKTE